MHVQFWTAHYEPQRSGVAPLVSAIAKALAATGVQVSVVAAHPFYPDPSHWPRRRRPERTFEDGIAVTRLPIYTGRSGVGQRVFQDASHAATLAAAGPFLGCPDIVVAVSPLFLGLLPAMAFSRLRRIPWVLWLQDILPDGATATGMVEEGASVKVARRLETAAYRSAGKIVVIADSFKANLRSKGVSEDKLVRLYNPATVEDAAFEGPIPTGDGQTVMTMGNIGYSQNLRAVVEAFEADRQLAERDVHFVLAGDGAAADDVRAAIKTDRTRITGFLDWDELEAELGAASVALVSQQYPREALDFNVPSKLANFMARGLPVVAVVRPQSEVARIVRDSDCGWIVDADDPSALGQVLTEALGDETERVSRGGRGRAFADRNFRPAELAVRLGDLCQSEVQENGGNIERMAATLEGRG